MDPFLALLNSFSSCLSESDLAALKFLCRGEISKKKLESVQSGRDLFSIFLEQQLIASDNLSFLEELFKNIKRQDLVSKLKKFEEEGEAGATDDQPDAHEKPIEVICDNVGRDWKMLMRKLDISDVKLERIVAAHPCNLYEQLSQSLREWQKWKGRDAKVTDLIKALRDCRMNLVADKVEQ
ncbi:FADD protein, partial [Thinocorus orbignyianus]|nr:FADD protein [Thinocorus orbignyianus]